MVMVTTIQLVINVSQIDLNAYIYVYIYKYYTKHITRYIPKPITT